jgi:hypothetical protein
LQLATGYDPSAFQIKETSSCLAILLQPVWAKEANSTANECCHCQGEKQVCFTAASSRRISDLSKRLWHNGDTYGKLICWDSVKDWQESTPPVQL